MKLKHLVLGIGATLAVAAPSCAVSAPTATGTFVACYKTNGGAVHFTNESEGCASDEKQATWNQTGPAGPAGPTGTAGIAGPTYIDETHDVWVPTAGQTAVATVTVPAGSYQFTFTTELQRNGGTGTGALSCYTTADGKINEGDASSTGEWDKATLSFQGTFSIGSQVPVTVNCLSSHPASEQIGYWLQFTTLTVTRITSVVSQ